MKGLEAGNKAYGKRDVQTPGPILGRSRNCNTDSMWDIQSSFTWKGSAPKLKLLSVLIFDRNSTISCPNTNCTHLLYLKDILTLQQISATPEVAHDSF